MKFNQADLFKVPFDSSYNNVVDYHRYSKASNVLSKTTLTKANIEEGRTYYFANLPQHNIYYDETKDRSVKITNESFQCSIAGDYNDMCDYNYIIFKFYSAGRLSKQMFCFITNISSNNDSSTPSCTISGKIDYWTTYITDILLNTPEQYLEYAHDNPLIYNGKNDSRVPDDFIMKNDLGFMFEDAILFLAVDIDREHLTPNLLSTDVYFDPISTTYVRIYIPIIACTKIDDVLYFKTIYGVAQDSTHIFDASINVANGYWFKMLNSQYVYGATFTFFTPNGVMKASDFTIVFNSKYYLKVDTFDTNQTGIVRCTTNYNSGNNHITTAVTTIDTLIYPPYIYGSSDVRILPINNDTTVYTESLTVSYEKNINASYSPNNEKKQFQYPYYRITFEYKGNKYNITPEPTGTGTAPAVTLSFRKFSSPALKIHNVDNIAETILFTLNENDQLATAVDPYQRYKETAMGGDAVNMGIKTGLALTTAGIMTALTVMSGGAMAPVMIGGAIAGGVSTGASSIAGFCTNQKKLQNMPDEVNSPSNNAFDTLPSVFPIRIVSTLKSEDRDIIISTWKRFGYPIFELRQFKMERFWYDYKKVSEAKFPNITNPIARRTIEDIFNRGVTIWHANRIGNSNKPVNIGDYSKNNPSNTDCTEVIV